MGRKNDQKWLGVEKRKEGQKGQIMAGSSEKYFYPDNGIMQRVYSTGFRSMIAWKEAKILAASIFRITAGFPQDERYRLTDQLRRASNSVMANLAEGSAMPTKDHRNAYYARARGSTIEIDNFCELCHEIGLLNTEQSSMLIDHCARLSYLITRLMK